MSASSVAGLNTGNFDRVEVDGEEYLAHDVVAQREGVYRYPDPTGGIRKEFVPAEELSKSIEGVDEVPIVLSHPETPDGSPTMMTDPRANYSVVGKWQELRTTRDDNGIAGRTLIRVNEIGEHDGQLREYIQQVNRFGVGEVSTGYDIEKAESDQGRYNDMDYSFTQRGLDLDHLALLTDEQGDCSVEDGCGLGRANHLDEGDEEIRVNNHFPTKFADDTETTPDPELVEELGESQLKELGKRFLGVFSGVGEQLTPDRSNEESDSMDDSQRINELVEQYDFTRERLEPLEGSTCLTRIHEAVVDEESSSTENMGDGNQDNPSGDGDGDDPVFTEEQEERLNDIVEEHTPSADEIASQIEVPTADEEIVEEAADIAAERANEVREHQENVALVAESEAFPNIGEEEAQRMNEEVVSDLAEQAEEADEGESEGEERANYAGRPVGSSFDSTEYETSDDGPDVPVAGADFGGDE